MATPTLHKKERLKTPALCHKSVPPKEKPSPGSLPPDLHAYVRWIDLDPAAMIDVSTTVHLLPDDAFGNYSGQSPEEMVFVVCTLNFNSLTQLWLLAIALHGVTEFPDLHEFQPFAIDLFEPFATGLQSNVFISGRDERHAKIAA